MERELVLIVHRGEQGSLRCRRCSHIVDGLDPRLGNKVWEVIARGGSLLCHECSITMAIEYPGAFEKAD